MPNKDEREESSEDVRPDAAEAVIPEIVWKVLQGVLTAVMVAVLSWAWKLEARLTRSEQLLLEEEKMAAQIQVLEAKIDSERRRTDEHFTKIQIIENEIKHIREGVDEIKVLLSDRPKASQLQPAPRPIVVTAPPQPAPVQLSEPADRRRRGNRGK